MRTHVLNNGHEACSRAAAAHQDDVVFVGKLLRKNEAAWTLFFATHRGFCQSVAYKYQRGHEFDDLFSMLVLKLLGAHAGDAGALRRYDGSAPLKTYVYFVFKHLVLNHIRDSQTRSVTVETDMPIEQYGTLAPDAAADGEEDALLAAAVATLEPRDRRLIRLYHYQELTVRQIGQMLGCDASTVSRHLHRIHEALREKLETPDGALQRKG